jgi:Asp-tRNA(Asn)/Glu-tRNA(Gln) amidotransferase C subunit
MAIANETLQAIIRDYGGFALSDEELERVRPELDNYLRAVEQLRELDLSDVLSARLLRVQEGGQR